ncbi:MAG: hypothetical protein KAR64_09200 [Thermoplasmatales archaeon]|nr:hypothetical protein [Thermoplasmatales archaeon]
MWNEPSEVELAKIPRLYETEDVPAKDKITWMHFFLGSSDWYIVEYDGDDIFFGFACLNGWTDLAEWGYISFRELKQLKVEAPVSINGQKEFIPLEVDRDLHWTPKKASDVLLIVRCGGIYG